MTNLKLYKELKAPTAAVTELLEHLKLHDEHGDAECVSPPDTVADQGQPHWYQDFLSFVAKQKKGKLNCSLHFLPSGICKVNCWRHFKV